MEQLDGSWVASVSAVADSDIADSVTVSFNGITDDDGAWGSVGQEFINIQGESSTL